MEKTIETVVSEQGVLISVLVKSHSEIKETLKEISDTQRKIEVLMERQSNHEEQTRSAIKDIHDRMNKHDEEAKYEKKVHGEYCGIIEHKADNGDKAYKGMMWVMLALAGLALESLYNKLWGN